MSEDIISEDSIHDFLNSLERMSFTFGTFIMDLALASHAVCKWSYYLDIEHKKTKTEHNTILFNVFLTTLGLSKSY